MLTVSTPITLWLSLWFGLWFVAAGIGALLRSDRWGEMLDEFARSPGLALVTGALAFAVGAVVVTLHNVWTDPAAVIVSLIGWTSVAEGFVLVAAPHLWLRIAGPFLRKPRLWGVFAILLGALLFVVGIAGRADTLTV